jgi:hypothetical protein
MINFDCYIGILATASRDANQAMNMKVEEASDIEVEELFSFAGINSEHEVRCMSVCPLLGRSNLKKNSHYT